MTDNLYTGINLENPGRTKPGRTAWRSPSNIAIIKYWGKYGNQLPKNPSISITLTNACSETSIEYRFRENNNFKFDINFQFEGKENIQFGKKIESHFTKLESIFPFLSQLSFNIQSSNSFPHSSGIASSASSMSALALCLCDIESQLFSMSPSKEEFLRKASFVARICSGSASRSVFPYAAVWGKSNKVDHSSDYYAIDVHKDIHPVFQSFHDDILIVSKKEKSVSSTAGHQLMDTNIFAEKRYEQANQNMDMIYDLMQDGNVDEFGRIAESEALTLHALMMCSNPSFLLLEPQSLTLIKKIRNFRSDTGIPIYFTIDAGPNLHVLYPDVVKAEAQAFIKTELMPFCDDGKIIFDQAGPGPEKN